MTLCSWKGSIMKYRLLGVLIGSVLLFSTACQSVSGPAGSEPDNTTMVDDDTTTADDDNTSPVGEDGEPLLTEKQADTIAPVTRAASVIAKAVAAIVPIQDLQDVLFGNGSLPTCPQLDTTLDSDTVVVTFDYGTGCSTTLYSDARMKGSVGGDYFFSVNAVEFFFTDLSVNQTTMTGRVAGGFAPATDQVTFALNVNVTLDDGSTVSGGATVVVENATGVTTISNATVAVAGADQETLSVAFEDILVDTSTQGDFRPESGVARFIVSGTDSQPQSDAMRLQFAESTATNGTVGVSINSGDEFAFTPE